MNNRRYPMSKLSIFALVLLLGTGLTACAEEQTILLIRGATVLGADCKAGGADNIQAAGVLDVSVATGYVLAPSVENIAAKSGSVGISGGSGGSGTFSNLNQEGNRIIVNEAEVDINVQSDLPGSVTSNLTGFTIPIGGSVIDPGASAAFTLPVINAFQVQQLATTVAPGQEALIVVQVRLKGVTSSDTAVESNLLEYPISVCNGCLVVTDCDSEGAAASGSCVLPGQDVPFCPQEPVEPPVEPEPTP